MQSSEGHFVWDADPILFTIPEISLLFPLSLWGLAVAAILVWTGWQIFIPKGEKEQKEIPPWKPWGIIIGGFVLGQLLMLPVGGPVIETIGPVSPRWYGLMFACAFIFGYLLCARLMRQGGRNPDEVDLLLIYVLVATIIGARLGHVIFYDLEFYLRNPQLIPAVWRGGLASHGAAIAIIIAMWLYVRRVPGMTFYWLADRVVPAVAVGGMFIRIGNFFNSEILGTQSDLPWAIVFANVDSVPRHPSMLYESLSTVIVLAVLMLIYRLYDRKPPEGSLFGSFLVLLFSGRFLIEFTKLHHSPFEEALLLNMGQWLSIPLVLFGAWLLLRKVKWKTGNGRKRKG